MARRPYTLTWGRGPAGAVITPSRLRNLDQFSSELVNGEEGGTYAPSDPIVLGSSVTPAVAIGNGSTLTGDVTTADGNSRGDDIDTPGLVLQGGAYPAFVTPRERTIVVPFVSFNEIQCEREILGVAVPTGGAHSFDGDMWGVKTASSWTVPRLLLFPLPLRAQHTGATIDWVDFRYRITRPRSAIPAIVPKFRVARCSTVSTAGLHTNGGGYNADGFLPDQAATAADYWNYGQTRTLRYTPDQYNTSLAPQNYQYVLEIWTEKPSDGLDTVYLSATVKLSAIATMRHEY